jgi:hypothetical protein
MKIIELISLDDLSLKEINGGNQETYELGQKVGEIIRKLSNFWWLIIL